MTQLNQEIERVIFQALSNPRRCTIIEILGSNQDGISYTELLTELSIPTGKLNYHLEQLEGLIEKNAERHYLLTPLGKKALNVLNQLKSEVNPEDQKYLNIAEIRQRSSLEPTLKSFIFVGILGTLAIGLVLATLAYVALTNGDLPIIAYVLLPLLFTFDISVAVTLVTALRKVPNWLRRIEHRFIEI